MPELSKSKMSSSKLESVFVNLLAKMANFTSWWYGIDLPPSDDNSLSRMLGMNDVELGCFLHELGLSKKTKAGTIKFNLVAWESFYTVNLLRLRHVEWQVYAYQKGKDRVFLRVGKKEDNSLQMKEQLSLKHFKKPPSQPRTLTQDFARALYIVQASVEPSPISRSSNEDDIPIQVYDTIAKTTTETEQSSQSEDNQQILSFLESIEFSEQHKEHDIFGSNKKELVMEFLSSFALDVIEKLTILGWKPPLSTTNSSPPLSTTNSSPRKVSAKNYATANEDACFKELLEEDSITFPVLRKFGIDPQKQSDIAPLLRDLYKLRNRVKSSDIFSFAAANDKALTLVNLPRCSTYSRFKRNARRSNFILQCLMAVVDNRSPSRNEIAADEEADGPGDFRVSTAESAALCFLQYLGSNYREQFIAAAVELGFPIMTQKMPAKTAAAMYEAAGIGPAGHCIIRKFFMETF